MRPAKLPAYPRRQGGYYRPHYPARETDNYMQALLDLFQKHCRHKWYRRSCTELVGGSVDSEAWDTCENCGKERVA